MPRQLYKRGDKVVPRHYLDYWGEPMVVQYCTKKASEVWDCPPLWRQGASDGDTFGGWVYVGPPEEGWRNGKPPRLWEDCRDTGRWWHVANVKPAPPPPAVEYL